MALVQSSKTPIGWDAPGFDLPGTDGKSYSLDSFKDAKELVVIFTCNHCPYARAAWPLLIELAKKYSGHGISFVGINPNDEITFPEDGFEEMKKKVPEWGINFPYLRDESQKVARAYDAQCTPDIYLFDKNRRLYYRGRINDNWQKPEDVTEENLRVAIENLLRGDPPPENQAPSMGCSIKWKS